MFHFISKRDQHYEILTHQGDRDETLGLHKKNLCNSSVAVFFPVLVMQAYSYTVFVKYQTKSNGLVTETITKYKNLFTCFMLSKISLLKQNKIVQLDLR